MALTIEGGQLALAELRDLLLLPLRILFALCRALGYLFDGDELFDGAE